MQPDDEPGGFWVNRYPPDLQPTIGEDLDFRLELDDQTFDALVRQGRACSRLR